jgi:AraC-like DNA-binding protein
MGHEMQFLPRQYYFAAYIKTLAETALRLGCAEEYTNAIQEADLSAQVDYVDAAIPDEPVINCYTKYPRLSFEFGRDLTSQTHGFMGYALKSSASIGEALEMWSKYMSSRISMLRISLDDMSDDLTGIRLHFTGIAEHRVEFYLEMFAMCLCTVMRELCNTNIGLVGFEATYVRPTHVELYKEYFGDTSFRFNAPTSRLIVAHEYLELPIDTSDKVLQQLCSDQCEAFISQLSAFSTLEGTITRYLDNYYSEPPSLTELASQLAMSERTLKRRLTGEGSSYRRILSEHKKRKSRELLSTTRLNVSDISDYLGYSNVSAFDRAFRRWNDGYTPSQYRQEHANLSLEKS